MKEIICISGDLYSGKSTVGKILKEKLGYEYFSAGMIFRSIAEKMGLDVIELNIQAEFNLEIDFMIDSTIENLGKERQRIIVDSRMAWHFIKEAFRVHLILDIKEAGERALRDIRGVTEKYTSIEEAMDGIRRRKAEETKRYQHKYGVYIDNLDNYDLIINTSQKTSEEIAGEIINGYLKWLNN